LSALVCVPSKHACLAPSRICTRRAGNAQRALAGPGPKAATTWRRAFAVVPGDLVSKLINSCPQSPIIATLNIAEKIILDSSDEG